MHAVENFQKVLELSPDDAGAQRELIRSMERLKEQDSGIYDFIDMTQAAAKGPTLLDRASYTALVEIKNTVDRGRGLFAEKDIKAGELVLCEKAFAVGFKSDSPKDFNMLLNINTGSTTTGPNVERLCSAVTKLQHNPQMAKKFASLYNGGYQPATLGQIDGIVDIFQVEATLKYNGFCFPTKPTSVEYGAYNEWSSAGVWLVAAAMNHDCIGNVHSAFIGDMMVVRATTNIAAGEEILLRYHMGNDFEQFQRVMQDSWKFKCICRLCEAEGKTSANHRKSRLETYDRARILRAINPITSNRDMPLKLVKEAERLLELMASTYDPEVYGALPRKCLFELSHWISQTYALDPLMRGRLIAQNTLRYLGVDLTVKGGEASVDYSNWLTNTTGVSAMTFIALSYKMEQRFEVAKQVQAFGEQMYEILNGSTYGFSEKHP